MFALVFNGVHTAYHRANQLICWNDPVLLSAWACRLTLGLNEHCYVLVNEYVFPNQSLPGINTACCTTENRATFMSPHHGAYQARLNKPPQTAFWLIFEPPAMLTSLVYRTGLYSSIVWALRLLYIPMYSQQQQ